MIMDIERYLHPPYRCIEKYDLQKRFKSSDTAIDQYPLDHYFEENKKNNCASIVRYKDNKKKL